MNGPSPGRLWKYVVKQLCLQRYLDRPGDGRWRPDIPAPTLLWALLPGPWLRTGSFHGAKALVRSRARRNPRLSRRFGDDALGYFTARLDPGPTRSAVAPVCWRACKPTCLSLLAETEQRLGYDPAPHIFRDGKGRIELWDRDDFHLGRHSIGPGRG